MATVVLQYCKQLDMRNASMISWGGTYSPGSPVSVSGSALVPLQSKRAMAVASRKLFANLFQTERLLASVVANMESNLIDYMLV